jgi:ribosomal protein S17
MFFHRIFHAAVENFSVNTGDTVEENECPKASVL